MKHVFDALLLVVSLPHLLVTLSRTSDPVEPGNHRSWSRLWLIQLHMTELLVLPGSPIQPDGSFLVENISSTAVTNQEIITKS